MRKLFLFCTFLFSTVVLFASAPVPATMPQTAQINALSANTAKKVEKLSYKELKTIFEQQKGRKLSLVEKTALRLMPKKINKEQAVRAAQEFKIGGFLLGFFLGLIGVLIAYLALSKEHGVSSLYGLAAVVVLSLVVFLVL